MGDRRLLILAAPDKFRGTADAPAVARAIALGAADAGARAVEQPLADGGEGTLEVLGGPNRHTVVTGPLGDEVTAGWRLSRREAVIEMARASGLALVGGPEGNDALAASTYGTGELIDAAVERGAKRVVVTVGGSATTDGGLGALEALWPLHRLRGVELVVACDVSTLFLEAAARFGPQKGATPAQVALLERRLEQLAQRYETEHGLDVATLVGGGAAGGLAGGLAAVGAELVPGFELVAERVGLDELVEAADLVVTGEGHLDATSFDGKVVGGVAGLAAEAGRPVLVVAGRIDDGVAGRVAAVSLVEQFGEHLATGDTVGCVRRAVSRWIGDQDG